MTHETSSGARPDLILVGCVKSKRPVRAPGVPAADLYDSPLWQRRRDYAERAGVTWFILSAEHGLLAPETAICWYDTSLADFPVAERRHWSGRVLDDLRVALPILAGVIVEIHAGKLYYGHGLLDGLRAAGAIVRVPLRRVSGIGPQCRWYREQATAPAREGGKG